MRAEFILTILVAVAFPLLGVSVTLEQRARRRPNRPPKIVSFTSSQETIQICKFASLPEDVFLFVEATDPDGDALRFKYSAREGTISGEGSTVLWSLHGLPPGTHEVRVGVSDGRGAGAEASLTVATVDAEICDAPPPPCPVVRVVCREALDKALPFPFSAVIEEPEATDALRSFYWKINAGRIVKGQHSREIDVTTTGANGFEGITATVEVSGFDPSCAGTTISCTTKIIW